MFCVSLCHCRGILVCRSSQLQPSSLAHRRLALILNGFILLFSAAPECTVDLGSLHLPCIIPGHCSYKVLCARGRGTAVRGNWCWEERMRSQVWYIQLLTSRGASLGCNNFREYLSIDSIFQTSKTAKRFHIPWFCWISEVTMKAAFKNSATSTLTSCFVPSSHFPSYCTYLPKAPLEQNSFSLNHTCFGSFPPYILGFPSCTPCIGLLSAEFRGGLSLEAGAGKGCLKPLRFSTLCAQQVLLDVFSLKKVWRSDAEDGQSRAVKQGKERDEIPVICLLQPSPSSWGRKQPSAAEKTVLRFIALADSQKKSPKKWWGRLQEQTMVWQTDPPAKHQTGQERGKGLKHLSPFLIY